MKKIFNKFKENGLLLMMIMLLCSVFGVVDGMSMTADAAVVNPDGGGAISVGDPNEAGVTETITRIEANELIRDTFERNVILKRPEHMPLIALIRYARNTRGTSGRIVTDFSLGTKAATVTLNTAIPETELQAALDVSAPKLVSIGQTLIASGINGFEEDGVTASNRPLTLYCKDKDSGGKPIVVAFNGGGVNHDTIPAIAANTKFNLAGTAATERQARGHIHTAIPTGKKYYLQKFDTEVQTSNEWMKLIKEANWSFPEQVEDALYEMHRRKERSYLIGTQTVRLGHNKYFETDENIYTCEGMVWQAKNDFDFAGTFDINKISDLSALMFKGNIGGKDRVVLCGTGLLTSLQNIDGYNKMIYLDQKKDGFKGLDLTIRDLVTVMGTMTLVHHPAFDDMDINGKSMTDFGLWLDTTNITEYQMYGGLQSNELALESSGQALAKGTYFYEISALIDRYPETAGRIWSQA